MAQTKRVKKENPADRKRLVWHEFERADGLMDRVRVSLRVKRLLDKAEIFEIAERGPNGRPTGNTIPVFTLTDVNSTGWGDDSDEENEHRQDPQAEVLDRIAWRDFDELGVRRYSFRLLLGESAVWAGPGSVVVYRLVDGEPVAECRFCGHLARLSAEAYCLGCDAAGKAAESARTPEVVKRAEETTKRLAEEADAKATGPTRYVPGELRGGKA